MKAEIKTAVDRIFDGYNDTDDIRDFKEEIAVNMAERIEDLKKGGMRESDALNKAVNELGDISEIAGEFSRQRLKEVMVDAYTKNVALDKLHIIGYIIFGLLALFGIITTSIVAISSGTMEAVIGSLGAFMVPAIMGFTLLGLTQDSRENFPLSFKRAAWYALAVGMILFGAFVSATVLFSGTTVSQLAADGVISVKLAQAGMKIGSFGVLIAFVLPGIALLAYLVLTEKDRRKPWYKKICDAQAEKYITQYDEKFGMLSGALWILAIGTFILLTILVSLKYSWFVFPVALSLQLLLNYSSIKK